MRWAYTALVLFVACAEPAPHSPAPAPVPVPVPVPAPVPAPAPVPVPVPVPAPPPPSTSAPYELHEWAVVDLPPAGSTHAIELAAGAGRRVRPPSGLSARKPVVYVHLLDGTTERAFSLRVTLPSGGAFVEHHPPASIDGTSLAWTNVVAHDEHCATHVPPAPEPARGGSIVPMVQTPPADVRGPIARELVRSIVRRHLNEVRFCYERSLAQHGEPFDGRVLIDAVVAATGIVMASSVSDSSLADPSVGTCVADAVRRWTFPEAGSIVALRIPFEFNSNGEVPSTPCRTRDHVCELHELPHYDAPSAACLETGERRAGLLFYRGTLETAALPLTVERSDTVRVTATAALTEAPGDLARVTLLPGRRVVVRHAPFPAAGQSVELAIGDTTLVREDEVATLLTSLAALGMTPDEAEAFITAWADDLFPPAAHHADPGVVPGPRYHDALIAFLPPSATDAIATLDAEPAPRVIHRAFMVRYDFGELPDSP